ncbi:MAG: hypothetical protein ACN6NV_03510 [Acinetobacter gandensis]|uniref:hypothetical protein n=1 Tax=Acinetobacter gandensis TaxID=1443941 RepID=UPI003CFD714A
MDNKTFTGSGPTWANACVGDNGQPNYIEYSKGYSKAANLLLNYILNSKGEQIDHLIYPICFNMRHSIELRLKGAIEEIRLLAHIKKIDLPCFNLITSHDIGNIWSYFKINANLLDTRFRELIDRINETICDIASIDPTGQTFRYPRSNDDQTHLVEQGVINCYILDTRFKDLEDNLDDLIYLIDSLIDEYKLGTFTKNLSRQQIFELTTHLPPYEQWSDNSFKAIKEELTKYYKISNNELTKAIKLIKDHYELSHKIGTKKPLAFLNDVQILELCDIWITYFSPDFKEVYSHKETTVHKDEKDSNFIDDFFRCGSLHKKGMILLEKDLSDNYVSDLQSLYYLSIDKHKYSENYISSYELFQKQAKYKNIRDSLSNILSKVIFLEELVKSLFFLHQIDLAEKIIKIYNLETIFNFIPEARNRLFFRHFELMGY